MALPCAEIAPQYPSNGLADRRAEEPKKVK